MKKEVYYCDMCGEIITLEPEEAFCKVKSFYLPIIVPLKDELSQNTHIEISQNHTNSTRVTQAHFHHKCWEKIIKEALKNFTPK